MGGVYEQVKVGITLISLKKDKQKKTKNKKKKTEQG